MEIPYSERYISYKFAYRLAGLMEFIFKFSYKDPRLSRDAIRQVGRQYDYSIEKARQELGYEPSISLIDGIRQCSNEK